MTVSSGSAKITLPSDTEILITRELDAPCHLIFKAWTTPELVRQWWSGRRGQMTIAEIDLREGGAWRFVMTANDGREVAFRGEYREIVPGERIVHTEIFEPMAHLDPALNIVTFTERDGRTTVEILQRVESKEVRDMILESGMEIGMQEQMDLLEALAQRLAAA
jgi:uncharacterized protein YndB with AHSA1/START domain